jgi:hypothetical protein
MHFQRAAHRRALANTIIAGLCVLLTKIESPGNIVLG